MAAASRGLLSIPSIPIDTGTITSLLGNILKSSCNTASDNSSLVDGYVAPTFNPTNYIENLHSVPRYTGDNTWNLYSNSYAWGIYGAGITIGCVGAVFTILLAAACFFIHKRGGCGVPRSAYTTKIREPAAATKAPETDVTAAGTDGVTVAPASELPQQETVVNDGVDANTVAARDIQSASAEAKTSRRLYAAFYAMGLLTLASLSVMTYGLWKSNVEVNHVEGLVTEVGNIFAEANTTMYDAIELAAVSVNGSALVLAYGTLGCSGILGTAADAIVSQAASQVESYRSDWQKLRVEYLELPAGEIYNIADAMQDTELARNASIITLVVLAFLGSVLLALQITAVIYWHRDLVGNALKPLAAVVPGRPFNRSSGGSGGGSSGGTAVPASDGGGGGGGDAELAVSAVAAAEATEQSGRKLNLMGRSVLCLMGLLLLISYVCVAAAFMSALFAGDYCVNPNELTLNAFTDDTTLTRELVSYYTTCNGTESNQIQDLLITVDCYRDNVAGIVSDFNTGKLPNRCGDTEVTAEELQTNLLTLGNLTQQATELAACSNVNPLYVDIAYDSACHNAVRYSFFVWLGGSLYIIFLMAYMFLARAISLRARREVKVAAVAAATAAFRASTRASAVPAYEGGATAVAGTTEQEQEPYPRVADSEAGQVGLPAALPEARPL